MIYGYVSTVDKSVLVEKSIRQKNVKFLSRLLICPRQYKENLSQALSVSTYVA